jgi:hypothetical protein
VVPLEHFELNKGYAVFRPEGPTTVPAFLSLVAQAMEACLQNGVKRLLVDGRKLNHLPLTTVEWFELGSGVAAFWNRDIKLVMVGRPDQIDPERFGCFVAENRGLRVNAYASEAEALSHLLAQAPGD